MARRPVSSTKSLLPIGRMSPGRWLAFGYGVPLATVLAPLAMRAVFGALSLHAFLSLLVTITATLGLAFMAMTRAMRWSLHRHHPVRLVLGVSYAVCAAAMAAMNLAILALHEAAPGVIARDPLEPTGVAFALLSPLSDSLPVLVVWSGVYLLPRAWRQAARHRARTVRVRRQAELMRLRAHLEPHFVLNTLSTIAGLVVDEPREARRLLGLLGDLFRDATADRDRDEHPLGAEVAWLERYAAIHQVRHREHVRFAWAIDADAAEVSVPRLVLQPLVENAVVHGALRSRDGGVVRVAARVEREAGQRTLVCEVEDDGPGFSGQPRRPGARGMRIVERRLRLMSPGRGGLEVSRAEGTTRVTLRWRLEAKSGGQP